MSSFYAEPPRDISMRIKLENLFGGFSNQFGWIFLSFGLIFVWAFTLQSDLTSWYHFRGEIIETMGTVSNVSPTNMTVNESKIYKYDYRFEDNSGIEYKSSSYSSSRHVKKNDSVIIEFPIEKPEISRIKGMRRGMMGLFGLFPLIFPSIGLIFIFFGLKKGIKSNRLLVNGYFAEGKLISKTGTNTRVNNQLVYKFIFNFHARDGSEYSISTKTHRIYKLEDEAREKLLYDNKKPTDAVMFDTLNASLRIDDEGILQSGKAMDTIKVMFIPVLSLIVHGSILFFIYKL